MVETPPSSRRAATPSRGAHDALALVRLLLLEGRVVVFCGRSAGRAAAAVWALAALLPGLISASFVAAADDNDRSGGDARRRAQSWRRCVPRPPAEATSSSTTAADGGDDEEDEEDAPVDAPPRPPPAPTRRAGWSDELVERIAGYFRVGRPPSPYAPCRL